MIELFMFPFYSLVICARIANSLAEACRSLKYGNFEGAFYKVQFNCKTRSAERFSYWLERRAVAVKRPNRYTYDPELAREFQQISTESYNSVNKDYNRGHLVPMVHMRQTKENSKQANYMTNIVPQAIELNQGLWRQTEILSDCLLRTGPINVFGGVINFDEANDFFKLTHGIQTPEYMWKVVVSDNDVRSWMFPNKNGLDGDLDDYIVPVSFIEANVRDGLGVIPVSSKLKDNLIESSWSNACLKPTQHDLDLYGTY
jgi:endonuclease G